MTAITMTEPQRKAFDEIVANGTTDAKEATVQALLRRNVVAVDGDGFRVTNAGKAFLGLEKSKASGPAKKAAKAAADKPADYVANVPGEVDTDAPVREPDPSKDLKANAAAAGQTDKKVKVAQVKDDGPLKPTEAKRAAREVSPTGVAKRIAPQLVEYLKGADPKLAEAIAKAPHDRDHAPWLPLTLKGAEQLVDLCTNLPDDADGAVRRTAAALVRRMESYTLPEIRKATA